MSATAQGVLFSFVFDSQFGVANALLDQVGIAPPGLPPGPRPGAVGDRADRALERDRVLRDRLPGGAAGHPARAGGGGVDRRRAALGDPSARRRCPALRAGHGLPARVADVPVAAAVRPRLRDHARRPVAVDHGRRALRLAAGVPVLQRRLRRGRRPTCSRSGCSWSRSCGASTSGGGRRASDEGAAVDPWHLVLAPMALVFALPLLWLLVSSFMTNAQINRFPPTIIPDSLHLDGYRYVFRTGEFARWFLNSTIVATVTVVVEPRVLLVRRLRVRAHALPRLARAARADAGDAGDPVPADDDPDLPADEAARADRHAWAR